MAAGTSSIDYVGKLHNHYMQLGKPNDITWSYETSRARNAAVWVAHVLVKGIEKGDGQAASKQAAKQIAAQCALDALGISYQ